MSTWRKSTPMPSTLRLTPLCRAVPTKDTAMAATFLKTQCIITREVVQTLKLSHQCFMPTSLRGFDLVRVATLSPCIPTPRESHGNP
jgi:hypothetical protein